MPAFNRAVSMPDGNKRSFKTRHRPQRFRPRVPVITALPPRAIATFLMIAPRGVHATNRRRILRRLSAFIPACAIAAPRPRVLIVCIGLCQLWHSIMRQRNINGDQSRLPIGATSPLCHLAFSSSLWRASPAVLLKRVPVPISPLLPSPWPLRPDYVPTPRRCNGA